MVRQVTDISDAWRQIVDAADGAALAHSPEWFTAIPRAYGHEPLYLTAEDDDGDQGVLPAFVVRRPFFGTVVTSMPFLDGGGPCCSSPAVARELVEQLVREARRVRARAVELRSTRLLGVAEPPLEHKVNLALPLPSDPETLWRRLDKSVRNQVRKAERAGLSIESGGSEKLSAFYDVFVARMRDLGSPGHSPQFLASVIDAFGDRARVVLVTKGATPIGGLVALAYKQTIVVPWATCLKEHFALCPNMLLYWETIRTACRDGFERFEFGRSTRHSGTYRFKRQWGAVEEPLFWYTIPVASGRERSVASTGHGALALASLWQRLPLAVTRQLGPRIRKYLIQ